MCPYETKTTNLKTSLLRSWMGVLCMCHANIISPSLTYFFRCTYVKVAYNALGTYDQFLGEQVPCLDKF